MTCRDRPSENQTTTTERNSELDIDNTPVTSELRPQSSTYTPRSMRGGARSSAAHARPHPATHESDKEAGVKLLAGRGAVVGTIATLGHVEVRAKSGLDLL